MRATTRIGLLIFALGVFLLPLGYDALFYLFLVAVEHDYFKATVLMYGLSIGLIISGVSIASHHLNLPGPLKVIQNPAVALMAIISVVLLFFVVIYPPL